MGIAAALALAACSNDTACGEGSDPVVVTGLNGTLEGGRAAVEILYRVPETCEVVDRTWMFFDDATQTVSMGEEPTDAVLSRRFVTVEDRLIYFDGFAVGVELEYPGEEPAGEVDFRWFTGMDETLATVACAGDGATLICSGTI